MWVSAFLNVDLKSFKNTLDKYYGTSWWPSGTPYTNMVKLCLANWSPVIFLIKYQRFIHNAHALTTRMSHRSQDIKCPRE